jgi:hypothetical protein
MRIFFGEDMVSMWFLCEESVEIGSSLIKSWYLNAQVSGNTKSTKLSLRMSIIYLMP